jgi:hypothetical protein
MLLGHREGYRTDDSSKNAAFGTGFEKQGFYARVERALLPAAFDLDLALDLASALDLAFGCTALQRCGNRFALAAALAAEGAPLSNSARRHLPTSASSTCRM